MTATRNQWAERISDAWCEATSGMLAAIFSIGQDLIYAKGELEHGEFIAMTESDLPFGRRTAQMLMAVARDDRLTKTNRGSLLPPHWRTLYELTRLDNATFERMLDDGTIRPDMERSEVGNALRIANGNGSVIHDGCTVADLEQLITANKKYAVIYADPPWSFKVYSGKGKMRSAERHYDTQSLDEIKSLPVADLAADDCALLLWAVMPQLPEALEVIASWGFTYKTTGFVWIKENRSGDGLFTGMGYWTRANAELCLLATKGSPARQAKDVHQVVRSPVSEHSRKPDEVQVRIERLLPGPYLELFGRRAVPYWTVWGNQIERSMFHQHIPEFAYHVSTN